MAWMDIPYKPAPLRVFFVSVFAVMFFSLQGENPVWGGTLTIETQTTTEVIGDDLGVSVKVATCP
jgi:hypothetical protein